MLPNLSHLAVDVSTKPGRSPAEKRRSRVKKIIERGKRRIAKQALYFPVWEKWHRAVQDHFATNRDILADGVGYRCENNLFDLFNGSSYPGLGRCLHMAWDEFQTNYGETCAMFSTRALQNCGFTMMHGFRWDTRLLHIEEDNDPSEFDSDWLLDLWVKSRRVATEDRIGWKDRLRSDDQFEHPDTGTAKLLDRWEKGEWQIPKDDEGDHYEFWEKQTAESKQEFRELSAEAVHSAPWWVLRDTSGGFEPELLEFSVSSPEEDRDKLIKLVSCVLALVRHDAGTPQVIYSLPLDVKPGSEAAQGHAERFLMRMYDRETSVV